VPHGLVTSVKEASWQAGVFLAEPPLQFLAIKARLFQQLNPGLSGKATPFDAAEFSFFQSRQCPSQPSKGAVMSDAESGAR
jgi:hypothetical protein